MQLVGGKQSYKPLNLDHDGRTNEQTNGRTNAVSYWGASCFAGSPKNAVMVISDPNKDNKDNQDFETLYTKSSALAFQI